MHPYRDMKPARIPTETERALEEFQRAVRRFGMTTEELSRLLVANRPTLPARRL